MNRINAPLSFPAQGDEVVNLQAALIFLLKRGAIQAFDPPNLPTADELKALGEKLRDEQAVQTFGDATRQLVLFLQIQQGLGDGLSGKVDDATAKVLNSLLEKLGAFDSSTDFVVRGTIKDAAGRPQAGLVVIAFDRDLRRWQELGRAESNAQGGFEIPYRYESFRQAEGNVQPEVDLVLQVARRLADEALEPIHLHEEPKPVPPVASVDVVLPPTPEPVASEFERATSLITPLLKGQGAQLPDNHALVAPPRYADLAPHEIGDDDLPLIQRETTLGTDVVWAWAESARWTRDALRLLEGDAEPRHAEVISASGWAFFFGVLRLRRAGSLATLLRDNATTWFASQRSAAAAALVPALSDKFWARLVAALRQLQGPAERDARFNPGDPLVALLQQVPKPLSRALAAEVQALYRTEGLADPADYLTLADKLPEEAEAVRLFVRTMRVDKLVGGRAALARELIKRFDGTSDSLESLAGLGAGDWGRIVDAAAADGLAIEGSGRDSLVYALQLGIEQQHPAASLAARLEDKAVQPLDPALQGLANVLEQHRAGANALLLGKYLDSAEVKAIDDPQVASALAHFGRMGKLGLPFSATGHLFNLGVQSAGQLLQLGPGQLRNMLFDQNPPDVVGAIVGRVQSVADDISTATSNVAAMVPGALNVLGKRSTETSPPPAPLPDPEPTLRGIFGDLDECLCRPCESVLGLPAYLVDLLVLLQKTPATASAAGTPRSALDLLRERRSDITSTLQLSCENAETEVLHIDEAIRVLEGEVRHRGVQDVADALAQASYPWSLPFSASAVDVEAALAALRTSRPKVMAPMASPSSMARTRAELGLTAAEHQLLVEGNATPWWKHYGFAGAGNAAIDDPESNEALSAAPPELLQRVSVLMARTGLGLGDLGSTLATRFVGGLSITERDQCKTSQMRLSPAAEPAHLARLHRFVRLHRKLPGWSVELLDSALVQFNASNPAPSSLLIDDVVLEGLAEVQRIGSALRLAPKFVLGLRAPLTDLAVGPGPGSRLFDEIFLAPHVHASDRQRFAAVRVPGGTGTGAVAIGSVGGGIAAALGMDPREVAAHSAEAGGTLSLASLTWMFRHHVLSRALGLSIAQLRRLVAVTGIDPFHQALAQTGVVSAASKVAAFSWISALAAASLRVRGSGLPFDFALALLDRGGASEPPAGLRAEPELDRSLRALRSALRQVDDGRGVFADAPDVQLVAIERMLLQLQAPKIVEALLKELQSPTGSPAAGIARALTSASKKATAPFREPILTKPEAEVLLKPEASSGWNKAARYRFLYMRLLERFGDLDRAAVKALEPRLPTTQVVAVLGALSANQPTSTQLDDARKALSSATPQGRDWGTDAAWFESEDEVKSALFQPVRAPGTVGERYRVLLDRIARRMREQVLVEAISRWTGWPVDTAVTFLRERLSVDPAAPGGPARLAMDLLLGESFWASDAAPEQALVAWIRRLDRAAAFVARTPPSPLWLSLPAWAELDWSVLVDLPAADSGSAQEISQSLQRWPERGRLLDLAWLADANNLSGDALLAQWDELGRAGAQAATALRPTAARFGITEAELWALAQQVRLPGGRSTPAALQDLRRPENLRAVCEWTLVARNLQATASQLSDLGGDDLGMAASTARQLLAAQVGTEQATATLAPLDDALRCARRDALVAWLLQEDARSASVAQARRRPWKQPDDLYEHLLIDPQVQPCMRSTPIALAVASVQLFVQRILFGLVKEVTEADELRNRWTWMRSYRLWEANRKVFLFPENWLFPELRDDKSSSFKLLEASLSRGEIDHELARQAFGRFLDDVTRSGRIQVLGLYEDVRTQSSSGSSARERTQRDVYAVGRLPNPPYKYFWRHCQGFGMRWMEWTPWREIDVDVQGDHVMAFAVNGQLLLAWPLIEKAEDASSGRPGWRVEIAWSALTDERQWQPVQKSRSAAQGRTFEVTGFTDARSAFTFRGRVDSAGGQVEIGIFAAVNSSANKEAAPEPRLPVPVKLPADVYQHSGATQFAQLLSDGFDQIPEKYRQVIECFCTRERVLQAVNRGAFVSPFYVLLDVFGDPNAYSKHTQNIKDWPAVKPFVPDKEAQRSMMKAFVDAYINYSLGNSLVYTAFVREIESICSARRIRYRVWVKATMNGSPGLIELTPSQGTYSLELRTAAGATRRVSLAPSSDLSSTPWEDLRIGGLQEESCSVVWNAWARSGPETLKAVTTGNLVEQVIHFEINASSSSPAELGLDLAQSYFQVATARLGGQGVASSDLSKQRQPLAIDVANGEPWLNGFLEAEVTPPIETTAPGNDSGFAVGTGPSVFTSSKPWVRYWALGALGGDGSQSQPAVWHFSEGDSTCFVDRQPFSPGAGMSIYPDAAGLPGQARTTWQRTAQLPGVGDQSDTFGVEQLPPTGMYYTQAISTRVRAGTETFDARLPGACYNWEVFFHAPLLIADRLTKQHRFEDADRWLRLIFDPTRRSTNDPKAFLRFRAFRDLTERNGAESALAAIAQAAAGLATSADVQSIQELIERWRKMPLRPFVIARRRHVAFLWKTLFAYLDNLLSWADSLYRRETRESIGEATQLYVLAARILGPKPRVHQSKRQRSAVSFDQLNLKWDDFANAWIAAHPSNHAYSPDQRTSLRVEPPPPAEGFLHFCIPFNDKLFGYWNQLEDRLFNIRHCRNIEGIERTLPILAPPIDVELLVRAATAGLDLQAVVDGLYAPLPHHRFNILAAKAAELASEARSLGAALLSALEKRDAEELGQLRSTHEMRMLRMVKEVKALQVSEAEQNLAALRLSHETLTAKRNHFASLLGNKDLPPPQPGANGAEVPMLGDVAGGSVSQNSRLGLLAQEVNQIDYTNIAHGWSIAAGVTKGVAGLSHMTASIVLASAGKAGESAAEVLKAIGTGVSTTAEMFELVSRGWQHGANSEALLASHIRRRDEWAFQFNQTIHDLDQIDKQLTANEIRLALAQRERDNQLAQIEHASEVDEYLRKKFTNAELYDWMVDQLTALHFSAYRQARELARQAERAAARELGDASVRAIGTGHWDNLRSGLLAGEQLHQEIKRLELTFMERNRREHELIKHVSLRRLDPRALKDLITIGRCEFELPEWLFDLDFPGHFLRRLKSVSLSLPCVVGPYASVNCKLTLLRHVVRRSPMVQSGYDMDADDARFENVFAGGESIVTSTGRDDAGLFDGNLRDDRYLPFEHAGAVSRWRLELPAIGTQFDPLTISDAIVHLRYTARDGGEGLTASAKSALKGRWSPSGANEKLAVWLSMRKEFAAEWDADAGTFSVKVDRRSMLPYWMQGAGVQLELGANKAEAFGLLPRKESGPQDPAPIKVTKWDGSDLQMERRGQTGNTLPPLEDVVVVLSASRH